MFSLLWTLQRECVLCCLCEHCFSLIACFIFCIANTERYLLTSDTLDRCRDATSPSKAATSMQYQASTTPESRAWKLVANSKSADLKIAKEVEKQMVLLKS